MPSWLKERFEAGQDFNRVNRPRYPFNEVEVDVGASKKFVVDSYDPVGGEIVSRKLSQLASVKKNTAIGYLRELEKKYPSGATITKSRNIGQAYFIETKINSEIIILPNLLIWKLFLCPSFGFLVKKALSH